jgi:DNA-binding transcriptional LysR family regulator
MERLLRLNQFWNWLPVFRVVAETQNIHAAAEVLHVSPSALSRTVRLLEETMDQPLFRREGRKLLLNPAGQVLLDALREGMRRIDDGLSQARPDQAGVSLCFAGPAELVSAWLLPATAQLHRERPRWRVKLGDLPGDDPGAAVLQGALDLAVTYRARQRSQLQVEEVCSIRSGVYCAQGHPLYGVTSLAVRELGSYRFVAVADVEGDEIDGWPAHVQRRVDLLVPSLDRAVDACGSGEYLALLPDYLPLAATDRAALRRLPLGNLVAARPVYALYRELLSEDDPVRLALAAVHRVVASIRETLERTRPLP